jgi:hypothetical protein
MVTATAWSATPSSFDVLGLNPLGSRRGGGPHRPALPDLDLRSARRIGNVAGAQHHDTGHDDCHCGQGGQPPPAAHAAHRSSPRRWATAAASPRPATPSLARIRETWTLAVLGVMNSSWPIWRLVRPAATSARTSASRG